MNVVLSLQYLFTHAISSSESTSTHAKLEDPVALSLNGRESEILFENNRSCGVFVRYIVQKYRHIFLVNKEGSKEKTSFVDTGVYTRNRAFRMYLRYQYFENEFSDLISFLQL